MDEEVKQLCDELFNAWTKSEPGSDIRFYMNSLAGRTESKLSQLANTVKRLEREQDVLKVKSDIWKQSYLDQVKENVIMQAKMLADEQA